MPFKVHVAARSLPCNRLHCTQSMPPIYGLSLRFLWLYLMRKFMKTNELGWSVEL